MHSTRMAAITMASTPTQSETAPTSTNDIDLDKMLQRSIDFQVVAETKRERVMQYCLQQHEAWVTRAAARERARAHEDWLLERQLCQQFSSLSIKKKVRWADQEENNLLTDVDDYPGSSVCSW